MVPWSDRVLLGGASMKIIKLKPCWIPEGRSVRSFVNSKNKWFNRKFTKAIDQEYTQYNEKYNKTIQQEIDEIK